MQDSNIRSDFLNKLTDIIHNNISNENFGVSELADAIGMSRSNLLRKVKKETGLSVSLFIRKIRIEFSVDLLLDGNHTVSEVSYEVGFNSPSYFIKCFHEHYGYPPGEANEKMKHLDKVVDDNLNKKRGSLVVVTSILMITVVAVVLFISLRYFNAQDIPDDKSIAVLPFINDSKDSSNIYIINGLMESILGNLQKISDIRVISRTSVEKYRNHNKTIPEIARELNVRYFVEGSGQKINDKILLSVQLIDAIGDKHLWAEQYNRSSNDVFQLQSDIARHIASDIDAIITPEEDQRISKEPTSNMIAYDFFLKGLDKLYTGNKKDLYKAIEWFERATNEDPDFARAYADIAIAYYLLDENKTEKQYSDLININADKALLLDDELEQSLIAKALYYQQIGEYVKAVPYLEKALVYNPNSAVVVGMLAHIYTSYLPDISKYLEYAIVGAKLDIASYDSVTASYTYLHISNALIQNGFVEEAMEYINLSLDYFPDNIFSHTVKAYIMYAVTTDIDNTKNMLLNTLKMDTTRLDVLQEVGKIYFYTRDFDSSYYYYQKYLKLKNTYELDIYPGENVKIAQTCFRTGHEQEATRLLEEYKIHMENDKSMYKNLGLAAYYASVGENDKSIEYLRLFSEEENYFYWVVLFLDIDPIFDAIKSDTRFIEVNEKIKDKALKTRDKMREVLIGKGILD